jgi:hypothetical protein
VSESHCDRPIGNADTLAKNPKAKPMSLNGDCLTTIMVGGCDDGFTAIAVLPFQ